MGQNILVTGGAGFVGSNAVRLLLSKGHTVTVLDNFDRGLETYISDLDVEIIRADLRDGEAMDKALKGRDAVFHLAAYGSVVESIEDPDTNFEINVGGTLNTLKAAVKNNVSKFIFSSTGGALMGNTPPPVNERSVPKPISPYGASKLACEGYCNAFAEAYDLNTVMFRFANVYGPYSAHKQGVFNKYLIAMERHEDLIVYGESVRDFIYVEDLVRGLALGLECQTTPGQVFHLSTNKGIRIEDLALEMLRKRGRNAQNIVFKEGRKGEVVENFAENNLAAEKLGFSAPTVLTDGLDVTFEWFDQHTDLWQQNQT